MRTSREQLRDLCIVHAFGEAHADGRRRVVGHERRDGLEALRRREEHERLAGGGSQTRVGLRDGRAGEADGALVAELGERDDRRPRTGTSVVRDAAWRISRARRSPS